MSTLIDQSTSFIIQGITGKQGSKSCESMLTAGSKIIAGVTPGKGGQKVNGIPVYNKVSEIKDKINATLISVPPKFAKAAILEAIEARIPLINILTENIPIHDVAYCIVKAKQYNLKIIGPSSVGIYSAGKAKCGMIASGKSDSVFVPGNIGLISKSGGMTAETASVIKQAGFGVSTAIGIGGDVLMGSSFKELIQDFIQDKETKAIVIYGEVGGTAEEDLAEWLIKNPSPKPIIAFIAGKFASQFPDVSLGHAGAIIEGNKGKRQHKVEILKKAGVHVVEVHHQIGEKIIEVLS